MIAWQPNVFQFHLQHRLCKEAASPGAGRGQGVVAAVAGSFAGAACDTLDTLRRTESSLRRLKKTRAANGAADAAGLSDIDKVGRQLLLDAQARSRASMHGFHGGTLISGTL